MNSKLLFTVIRLIYMINDLLNVMKFNFYKYGKVDQTVLNFYTRINLPIINYL